MMGKETLTRRTMLLVVASGLAGCNTIVTDPIEGTGDGPTPTNQSSDGYGEHLAKETKVTVLEGTPIYRRGARTDANSQLRGAISDGPTTRFDHNDHKFYEVTLTGGNEAVWADVAGIVVRRIPQDGTTVDSDRQFATGDTVVVPEGTDVWTNDRKTTIAARHTGTVFGQPRRYEGVVWYPVGIEMQGETYRFWVPGDAVEAYPG
jgi:hypothetical protein